MSLHKTGSNNQEMPRLDRRHTRTSVEQAVEMIHPQNMQSLPAKSNPLECPWKEWSAIVVWTRKGHPQADSEFSICESIQERPFPAKHFVRGLAVIHSIKIVEP